LLCESQQPESSCMKNLKVEATEERGPHNSREQVRILKEVGTLKAALISVGKPGQASAAAMQCLSEFGIFHDLQMTPQEAHHVTLCPQWKIVLNAIIKSRRNKLQCKANKQDRWNNREADRQAEKAFSEEHKRPGKFSGKYGPQPMQTEMVWRMPWGCWLERMLSEAWNAATEEFSEDWPSTTVHQIQGARITLSVSYNQKNWGAMQKWIASHALHGIAKPTQQAQLPLHQLQRLQSLQRHYPMPRAVSVATQRDIGSHDA